MKALVFSDLHCSIKHLVKIVEFVSGEEGKDIGALFFTGDAVNTGEPIWVVEDLIRALDKIGLPFFWVPGNNDFGRAYHKLNAKYPSLEGKIIEFAFENKQGEKFVRKLTGVGGSPASWAGQYEGESMVDKKAIAGSIFLSHYPPPGVLNWQKYDLPFPTSDKKFADSPLVHICGHIHHQWGTAYLGQTKVVKLASLETGYYAIMDLKSLAIDFRRFDIIAGMLSN